MKISTSFASALLVAAVVAQPGAHKRNAHGHMHKYNFARDAEPLIQQHQHAKRNIVTEVEWVTTYETVTAIVDASGTSYITGDHKPTEEPKPEAPKEEPKQEPKQAPKVEAPKEEPKQEEPASKTGGVFKEQSSTKQPEPAPTQEAYVPPPKEKKPAPKPKVEEPKTQPKKAPETTTQQAPAQPTYSAPEQPASNDAPSYGSNKPSGGSSGGSSHSGDLTWYDLAMGSCGNEESGKDSSIAVVAISKDVMLQHDTGNPNNNPLCGKTITIKAGGKTTKARVTDTCMGCAANAIDVSKKVFSDLGFKLGDGRVDCEWSFDS